jgi:hypothetical protein
MSEVAGIVNEATETTAPSLPYVSPNGEKVVTETKNDSSVENAKPTADEGATEVQAPTGKKYFETDEWKTEFGEETPEVVKSYKTKATEYEAKVKEYEEQLEVLKKETEFIEKNPKIKNYKQLLEQGKDFDENTIAFLNKDYTKIADPLKGLAESLRVAHPDWDEKEIAYELKTKYNLNQFAGIEDEDLTDEQREIKEIAEIKIKRDWQNEQKDLIKRQDEFKLVKPEEIEAKTKAELKAKEQREAELKEWNEGIKKATSQINSVKYEFPDELPIQINDVPVKVAPFNYEVSKEDKAVADKYMANLPQIWNEITKGAKSQDEAHSMVYNFILKGLTANKAAEKLAAEQFKNAYELSVKTDKKMTDTRDKGKPNPATNTRKGLPYVPPNQ